MPHDSRRNRNQKGRRALLNKPMTQIAARTRQAMRGRRGASLGLVLLIVVGAILLVSAVLFVGSVLWPQWRTAAPDAPSLPITVGNVLFNVPPAAIRIAVQRRTGAQERLDLAFTWPSLTPPDPHAKPPSPLEERHAIDRLFVTIVPQGGTLSPFERLNGIYPRYLAPGQATGPAGLIARAFRDGTPYQGEDLIYDPSAPSRFLVRCTRPAAGGVIGSCLLERRLGGTDLTVRFPRDWLDDWQGVANGIDRLIASLRPSGM
jgi:hypothetical protein